MKRSTFIKFMIFTVFMGCWTCMTTLGYLHAKDQLAKCEKKCMDQ